MIHNFERLYYFYNYYNYNYIYHNYWNIGYIYCVVHYVLIAYIFYK